MSYGVEYILDPSRGGGQTDWVMNRRPVDSPHSPRCPLQSHSVVYIKNHLFIVQIGPIIDKELEPIYRSDRSDRTYGYS